MWESISNNFLEYSYFLNIVYYSKNTLSENREVLMFIT